MLKYQLKKGVKLEVGMAFKYKSNEELEALISALGITSVISRDAIISSSSLNNSGLLIFSLESPRFGADNENKLEKRFIIRKYLVGRDERIMKKKDFFDKTEYDNGTKNNKGSVSSTDPYPNNTEGPKKHFVAYKIPDKLSKEIFDISENDVKNAQNFFDSLFKVKTINKEHKITGSFEEGTSLDGKNVLIYTRKNGSKVIIE
jgi:hypothetical protein